MAKESIEEIFRQFEQSNPRQQTDKIYNVEVIILGIPPADLAGIKPAIQSITNRIVAS